MAEAVGSLYYEVTFETREMVAGQRRIERELRATTNSLDAFGNKLSQITQAVQAYAAATYLIGQSDAYTKLNAQLALATNGHRELAAAQSEVRRIAQEAQTDISGVGILYARISTATKELGVSQAAVADITRTVALALKVSGATAQESASATLQLSQAFASGVLRGEEFNAVNEAAPRLMKALADGIGVPVGALRGLAEQGKLTSEVLAASLPKALQDLEKEAQSIQTISGAFQQLKNEMMLFIGEQANSSGAAQLTASAISTLASNINVLAAAAVGFASAKLAQTMLEISIQAAQSAKATLDSAMAQQAARQAAIAETQAKVQQIAATQAGIVVAREEMIAKVASANAAINQAQAQMQAARSAGAMSYAIAMLREAELSATVATKARAAAIAELAILGQQQARVTAAMTAAQTAQTAAMGAAGAAATMASRALGLLGGPLGAITTVLGLGVTAWAMWGNASKESEAKATEAVERSTNEIVADLDKQIAKLKERNSLAASGMPGIAKQETEAAKKLATLQGQIDNLMSGKGVDGGAPLPEAARVGLLQTLLGQYSTLAGKIQDVGVEQQKLEAAGTSSKLSQWMLKYASDAEKARNEIAKAKKDLGDKFTPDLEQRIRQKFEPEKKKAPASIKDKFNEAAYMARRAKDAAAPWEQINVAEQEELRKLEENYRTHGMTVANYEKAKTQIGQAAAQDRHKLMMSEAEKTLAIGKRSQEEMLALQHQTEAEKTRGRENAQTSIAASDPVAQAELELKRKLELNAYYAALDQENAALYAQERVALEQQTADRIAEIKQRERDQALDQQAQTDLMAATMAQSSAGQMLDILRRAGKERTGLGKALFLTERALAVATIILNTELGAAKAVGIAGPFGIPLATMIRATGYASAGMVAGLALADAFGGGRQYGGPVNAGSLYRVNETGRPEMFTAANGNQYMLGTSSGHVTPADKVGTAGGAPWKVIINNAPPGYTPGYDPKERSMIIDMAVGRAKSEIAQDFASNAGQAWHSLVSASNVRSRL